MGKNDSSHDKRGILQYVNGNDANQMIKLRRDATIFGREKADIIVKDPEISSTHCQIQNINDQYHIFDMNSSNGTYVNGERVIKSKLQDGDMIRIGSTQFRFILEDEKKVRHIPTLFKSNTSSGDRPNSLIETIIERELKNVTSQPLRIEVTYGSGKHEVISLNQKLVFLGRASSFGSFDQDSELSRKHLLIKLNETGEVFIEDQGSTNGSYINGKKISGMHLVTPDDEIKIGSCRLRVMTLKNSA
jgi:pSer/pThr/pTyr-binding forkhead associated (FHA) protein